MAGHHKLRRGDQITIYFNDLDAPRAHGKYLNQDDEEIRIEGTVGDTIGHDLFIPIRNIRMIERLQERRSSDEY